MKKIIISLFAILSTSFVSAQSLLSFGARGGLDLLMPKSEQTVHALFGGAGVFDLGYTYYWNTRYSGDWGIHTGLSAGYATNKPQLYFEQHYTNFDYLGNEMRYTTTGYVDIALQRVYVELPLMAAFRMNGFIMQAGLKAQCTAWSHTSQTLRNPSISAYYVPYDVTVTDEVITGLVSPDDLQKEYNGGAPFLNLLVAARIGYEFGIGRSGRMGMALYVDYNVLNNYTNTQNDPIIAVAPIADMLNPVPEVKVNNSFATAINRINPLQIGWTVYFAIEFKSRR